MKPAATKVKKAGRKPVAGAQPFAPQPRFALRDHYLLGGVLALTALVYLRCLGNAYVFDDHEMILVNRYIGEWSFLWKAFVNDSWWFRDPLHLPQSHYYRPLQDVWLGLNYQLFGLVPTGPHALMVGLHLVAVAPAYRIAERLSADRAVGLLAALFFGLLPVHAEAVVWATAIPESLAGTLQFGAFCMYLRYRDKGRASSLLWSMALFGGALLSHEGAIAFPILVAAHGFLFTCRPGGSAAEAPLASRLYQRSRDALTLAVPFIAVAMVYLGTRIAVLGFIAKRDVNNQATLAQVLLTIPTVAAHNLAVIMNPWQAGPSHRITWVNSVSSADFWMPATGLVLIALAGSMAVADSVRRKLYLFSVAWIFIAMAPVLNLAILYPNALVADRYMYFASYGWCLMVAQAAVATARAYPAQARPIGALVGLAAMLCAVTLWQVQHYWHDEVALFSRCIERFPDSGFCHNRLGMALQAVGDLKGGEQELTTAFKLDPTDFAAEYDLAMVHEQQQRHQEAAREAADALKHLRNAPASAYVSLAQLYDAIGDRNASESAFGQAARLPGGAYEVALARARIKLSRRDGAGAEQQLRSMLSSAPDDPEALLMLGSALAVQRRYDEALAAYQRVSTRVPGNNTVRFLIALTLHNLGRNEEALTQCQLVLQTAPGNPNATQLLQLIEHDLRAQPVRSGAVE